MFIVGKAGGDERKRMTAFPRLGGAYKTSGVVNM